MVHDYTMASLEVRLHNLTVLKELEEGDLVEVDRIFYKHWGVYIGNEEIVHLAGDENDGINDHVNLKHFCSISGESYDKAKVVKANFWDVTGESKAKKNNGKDRKCAPLSPMEIVERALSKIGEVGYNVLWDNCEHFAAYCRYDKKWSEQADTFWTASGVTAGVLVAGGLAAVGYGIYRHIQKKQGKEQEEEFKNRYVWS